MNMFDFFHISYHPKIYVGFGMLLTLDHIYQIPFIMKKTLRDETKQFNPRRNSLSRIDNRQHSTKIKRYVRLIIVRNINASLSMTM